MSKTQGYQAYARPRRPGQQKRQARRNAQRRLARATAHALTPAQRAFDPLVHRKKDPLQQVLATGGVVIGSLALHVFPLSLLALTSMFGQETVERDNSPVQVEIIEAKEPPPLPEVEEPAKADVPKAPPQKKEAVVKEPEPPKPTEAEPPPADPIDVPKEESPPPQNPPRRIVGLSFESTVTGGSGPSFAVGNTRMGRTDSKASDPNAVEAMPKTNQVATRIPQRGITLVKPKRRVNNPPPYPELLRAQGIEGQVVVMVTIGEDGRVTAVKIVSKSEYDEFNQAALKAAWAEQFDPATRDGKPIAYTIKYAYDFRLDFY